jgi:tyrosine-protein kinase Etk/Wzc
MGYLHRFISKNASPGVADYVAGDAELGAIMHPTTIDGFSVVARGTSPPNPAELLLHERFGELISTLSSTHDYVIMDTPPVLAVSDAAIAGRLAGCTLLVLKSAFHPMREIEEALKRLTSAGVHVRGTLFNQVGVKAGSYGYGNYGYTYYQYDQNR